MGEVDFARVRDSRALMGNTTSHHQDGVMFTQPGPCEGCGHGKACGELLLACEAFAAYHRGVGRYRWSVVPRVPDASIYATVFGAEG